MNRENDFQYAKDYAKNETLHVFKYHPYKFLYSFIKIDFIF